jgi:hypothetical protein
VEGTENPWDNKTAIVEPNRIFPATHMAKRNVPLGRFDRLGTGQRQMPRKLLVQTPRIGSGIVTIVDWLKVRELHGQELEEIRLSL